MAPNDMDQTEERETRVTEQMADYHRKHPPVSPPSKNDAGSTTHDAGETPSRATRRRHSRD